MKKILILLSILLFSNVQYLKPAVVSKSDEVKEEKEFKELVESKRIAEPKGLDKEAKNLKELCDKFPNTFSWIRKVFIAKGVPSSVSNMIGRLCQNNNYYLVNSLEGHTSDVCSINEMRNGDLVSCSWDRTIKIWHKNTDGIWKCIQTLEGHTDAVISVIEMRNGDLVSGSWDGTIKIWHKNTDGIWKCIQTLEGHTGFVFSIIEMRNGDLLSCSYEGTIKIWHKNTDGIWKCIQTLEGHPGFVFSIIEMRSGDLTSSSLYGAIKIWRQLMDINPIDPSSEKETLIRQRLRKEIQKLHERIKATIVLQKDPRVKKIHYELRMLWMNTMAIGTTLEISKKIKYFEKRLNELGLSKEERAIRTGIAPCFV